MRKAELSLTSTFSKVASHCVVHRIDGSLRTHHSSDAPRLSDLRAYGTSWRNASWPMDLLSIIQMIESEKIDALIIFREAHVSQLGRHMIFGRSLARFQWGICAARRCEYFSPQMSPIAPAPWSFSQFISGFRVAGRMRPSIAQPQHLAFSGLILVLGSGGGRPVKWQ
ncbi:MAG: hypothetical protein ACJ8LG_25450 [Massilia sp.]